ncbi:MAG: fumarylacetoacetate hydrolase family protein, partial [Bacteroidota bacterium]
MKKPIKYIRVLLLLLLSAAILFFFYLNRGLSHEVVAAQCKCLSLEEGGFEEFDSLPSQIYGVGLSYAGHINETASEFDPVADPPIFKKAVESISRDNSEVGIPSHTEMLEAIEELEPGIAKQINESNNPLAALMDYEVELGFVLLEDVDLKGLEDGSYLPKIGFFLANDLSSRSLAILGEGQSNRYDYWGVSKSFEGFTPASSQVWIPHTFEENSIPCIRLQTLVNGEIRQDQMSSDLIYTPLEMLQAIHRKYPNAALKKGDWVLTGTPGGVILSTPRWLMRLANMIGLDRFAKLGSKTREDEVAKFLKAGDVVISKGEGLG